ncbi:MAG: T9SS type A sorting domain-containing protein [Candidatus Eisenbacteria bacterium]
MLLREADQLFSNALPPMSRAQDAGEPRSATTVLNEIKQLSDRLDPAALEELQGYLERPSYLDHQVETTHFCVHYAESGPDRPAAGHVVEVAQICEEVWDFYHEERGWPLPASDGAAGGDARIDIYLRDLGWGVYGYTLHEEVGAARAKGGFIVLENDFNGFTQVSPEDARRASLAHEYFHMIQFSYGYEPEAAWFMEQSATMMEGEAYPSIRDHDRYVVALAADPHRRLDLCNGSHEYGAWIWPHYLSERWGPELLKRIWEFWGRGGVTMLAAMDEALQMEGESLDEAYATWAVWNAFLGENDEGDHYPEGAAYAAPACELSCSEFPLEGWQPSLRRQPEPLGANYIELRPEAVSADNRLKIDVEGSASLSGLFVISWLREGRGATVERITLDRGTATHLVMEWDQHARLLVVITQSASADGSAHYRLRAQTYLGPAGIDDQFQPPSTIALSGSPNPFDLHTTVTFALNNTMPVSLRIYDAQGRLLDTLVDGVCSPGLHGVRWGETAASNEAQQAGVYFCEIRTPAGTERVRLLRVR